MDFLQWLPEQNYCIGQATMDEPASWPPAQLNYAQLIADYLDFDWGQPQAESIALAMLLAIKNRLINPYWTPDESPPMPEAEDLVKAFILSQQIARN